MSGTEKQVAEREKLDAIQAVDTKFTHKQEAIFAAKKKGDIPTVIFIYAFIVRANLSDKCLCLLLGDEIACGLSSRTSAAISTWR